jgi:riboflavin kinase / FMN adenylyltransferase
MVVTHGIERFRAPHSGVVLSIGNFDGVHRGHVQLIETAQAVGRRVGAPVVLMAFDRHPLHVLAPERAPAPLTTLEERLNLLERFAVEHVIVLHASHELLSREALDFLASLVAHCHPRAIVEGPDFSFGRGRGGNIQTLREHAGQWGYELHALPAVHAHDLATQPTISSSSIRQALRDGRLADANAMLGRAYRIAGSVGHGAGRGAELGFATANLDRIPHMLPQQAVYAAIAQLADGALHPAAVNIGPQPTFGEQPARVEAHVLDFVGDLRGQRLGVHLFARLREQRRFASPAELVQQIARDVADMRAAAETALSRMSRVTVLPL